MSRKILSIPSNSESGRIFGKKCSSLRNNPLITKLAEHHLLVFLFFAFLLGLSCPEPGIAVSKPKIDFGFGSMRLVQFLNVAIIFFISGFRLKTDAAVKVIREPAGLFCGWFVILAWTPLVGFCTALLSGGVDEHVEQSSSSSSKDSFTRRDSGPLVPPEFAIGLTLFCAVPTTLTSGSALVSGCKATERAAELALLLSVSTNLVGCFTTPAWLSAVLGSSNLQIRIDVQLMVLKLVLSLFMPTIFGKLAQYLGGARAREFAKRQKLPLTIFANFNLVFVVWQSVSRSEKLISSTGIGSLVVCVLLSVALHLVFWGMNCGLLLWPTAWGGCSGGGCDGGGGPLAAHADAEDAPAQGDAGGAGAARGTGGEDQDVDGKKESAKDAASGSDLPLAICDWWTPVRGRCPSTCRRWPEKFLSDPHHRRAVFLLGSQKTLPVSLAIIASFPPDGTGSNAGMIALPCIFGHLAQLVMDSFLVTYWARTCCSDEEVVAPGKAVSI